MECTAGDELLGFCDQSFIKTCPVLDGYEVDNASNLERIERIIENILV